MVRQYARVYYADLQRDYPDVFYHPTAFGTYVRLLVLSEQSFPSDPTLPQGVKSTDLVLLRQRTLLVVKAHGQFQLKGYRKERESRQVRARKAADARWNPDA